MKYQNIFKIGIFFLPVLCFSQEITLPEQPTFGPGGSEYVHDSIFFQDFQNYELQKLPLRHQNLRSRRIDFHYHQCAFQ